MKRIQILRNGEDTPFTKPIKRALLREVRLSYGARGLFAMLWDFPSQWVYYSSHIVGMSPCGMTQLKNYLKELRNIGAINILPKQLTHDEAVALNKKDSSKTYRAGQITGKQWILNNPDFWAIEAPLVNANISDQGYRPKGRFSTCRQNQASVKPIEGESTAKVLQLEGLTIKELQLPEIAKTSNSVINEIDENYYFPKQLSHNERDIAKQHLACLDRKTGQQILDELADKLNKNLIKVSPLAYLRTLIKRAQQHKFTPEAGIPITKIREKSLSDESAKRSKKFTKRNSEEILKFLAAMHEALNKKQN